MKRVDRYIGVFDRGYGQEAIEIQLGYPLADSGVQLPPWLTLAIDGIEVPCALAVNRVLAAGSLDISPSTLSRSLTRHRNIQRRLGRLE